jgi:hypothetical protein
MSELQAAMGLTVSPWKPLAERKVVDYYNHHLDLSNQGD